MMTLDARIKSLSKLGNYLKQKDVKLNKVIDEASLYNPWFSKENIQLALDGFSEFFLKEEILHHWISKYDLKNESKKIGLVLAGNIPAVGFHDILCSFVAGHQSLIKYSDKDKILMPFLVNELISISPEFSNYFEEVERLSGFDGVIATGSDNSARYFESYFGKYQHIIRKNRNGIAVLNGNESDDDLRKLGIDVFQYFGLGCRNVSKIYVPLNYKFDSLLEILHEYNDVIYHNKYKNNFDYNIALYLINKLTYLNNGSIIFLEDQRYASRIATLHYEYYEDVRQLEKKLQYDKHLIQCVVSNIHMDNQKIFNFGDAQKPKIDDYADDKDTMKFLTEFK